MSENHEIIFPINADGIVFTGNKGDNSHIRSRNDSHKIQIDNDLLCAGKFLINDNIQNHAGQDLITQPSNNIKFHKPLDLNNQVITNLGGFNRQLTTSQILSSNLSGQSEGNDTLDKELDNLTISVNSNINRTSGLTSNKIMISNNSGTLQVGSISQSQILLNNTSSQQAITSDLNFASGKKIKYNGSQVALTDIAGYSALQDEVNLNTAKNGITSIHEAVIVSNTNNKLNKNLDNIGSSVVADANIATSISRVSATATLLNAKVNKSTPTFSGLSNGFCKIASNVLSGGNSIADGDLPSSIARVSLTVPKSGGTFSGSVSIAGLTIPHTTNIQRTQNGIENIEYCKSLGCLLGATPSSNNDQSIAGTKTFTDSTPINLSSLTASKSLVLDGNKNIATSESSLVSAGELAKIQALPSTSIIGNLAFTSDSDETLFSNAVGSSVNGNFAKLVGASGKLTLNTSNDQSSIIFDGDVSGGGFNLLNTSGNLIVNTNVDITSGHNYKINGNNLNFSNLAGTVSNSQIASGISGSKITSDIPVNSVPSGLSATLITTGTLDSARIPSLASSKIGSGTLDTARIPSLAGSKITSGTVADARLSTNVRLKNTDIVVATGKHIYRAFKSFVSGSSLEDKYITIAVLPSTSAPLFSYANSTFSILDLGRKCFGRFTIGVCKGSHTITVDTFVSNTTSGAGLGLEKIRIKGKSGYFDGNHREGGLLQIECKHTGASYQIYEHSAGNYIDTGFSLVEPLEDSTSQTNYTQISSNSTITITSPSQFSVIDEVDLSGFSKDYTSDHSNSFYDSDFITRNGGNAYFKKRIVLESDTPYCDIYQLHSKTNNVINGVFYRLNALETTLASAWTTFAGSQLESGISTNLGGAYYDGAYLKIGNLVRLRGILAKTDANFSGTIFVKIATLPSGYRPAKIIQLGYQLSSQIYLNPNGDVKLSILTSSDQLAFVSLDNISFNIV